MASATSDEGPESMRAMCAVLLVLSGFAGYRWLETYEPVAVIREQLATIDERQYPMAYGSLSSTAQATLNFEPFVAMIQNNSVLMEMRDLSLPMRAREGESAIINGLLAGYGQWTCEACYVLMQEDGRWKTRSFHWSAPHPAQTSPLQVGRQHAGIPGWEVDSRYGISVFARGIDRLTMPDSGAYC